VAQAFRPAAEDVPDRSATFVDYLADAQATLLVSEPDEVRAAIIRQREQIEASYGEALRKNQRAAEPGTLVIGWDEVADALPAATTLETLTLGTEEAVRHIASQPAMEFSGRIPDWVADLRQAREAGETTVFVARSQGRAERVVEMLSDYQVPAAPIDRGEDAHANAVLVAVGHLSGSGSENGPSVNRRHPTNVSYRQTRT
jgi:transcription-repair coupling factor (superfamily II helicase)